MWPTGRFPMLEKIVRDAICYVLAPEHIVFERRTTELTIAIMQLIASKRGLAALLRRGIQNFLGHEYVIAKPIGKIDYGRNFPRREPQRPCSVHVPLI